MAIRILTLRLRPAMTVTCRNNRTKPGVARISNEPQPVNFVATTADSASPIIRGTVESKESDRFSSMFLTRPEAYFRNDIKSSRC
jgi:hypothetical protein